MKIFLKNNIKNIHLRVFKSLISFMQLINWTEIVFMLIYYIINIGAKIITIVITFLKLIHKTRGTKRINTSP